MIGKFLEKYRKMPIQVRASFWFLICSFMQKGISVISTPIFTRLLTPDEYGSFNVFNSWLNIVTIFVTLRLYYGVYAQGLVKFEEEREKFASVMQGLLLALISAWTIVYLLSRNFWNNLFNLTTVQMLAMFVMMWATSAFEFWAAEQRVVLNYVRLVAVTIAVSIAKPTIGIIFVLHADDKVTARILGLALVELIGYTWCFFAQVRRGKELFSAKYWKYALLFNIPLVPHYLSQTVLNSADKIMIKSMVGSGEAGIYSLAYSISQIMYLFNQALLQTLTPWIYTKIKLRKEKDIAGVAYISLFLIAGVNIILIALAPEAVHIFAPKSYHDAIWIIPPVAMSVYFIFSYSLFAVFEFYFEKRSFILIASVAGALLNIVLNYFFIGIFGYYAAGYTTLACYMVYAIGHYLFMKIICNDILHTKSIYDERILVMITCGFVFLGFILLFTYKIAIARYALLGVMLVTAIIKKDELKATIKGIVALRKNKSK